MADFSIPEGWELRSSQGEAITKILGAFAAGKRIVVLQAPTGSGKSLIGRTVAMNHSSSYLLTPLISLQEQYDKDFSPDVKLFKGKAHYNCALVEQEIGEEVPVEGHWCQGDSDRAKKQRKRCKEERLCHYYNARQDASEADCALMNFTGFIAWMELRGSTVETLFDKRELHVIDEAHKIEETCRSYLEFKLNRDYIRKYADAVSHLFPDQRSSEAQIRSFVDKLRGLVWNQIVSRYIRHGGTRRPGEDALEFVAYVMAEMDEDLEMKKDLKQHVSYFTKIEKYLSRNDYAVGLNKEGDLVVQPTNVAWFIEDQVLGDFTLMMSATIPQDLILTMGFNEEEVAYIELDSTFPKENRPIFLTPAGNMNGAYKKSQEEKDTILVNACSITERILEKFPNNKGIIHVNSYSTVNEIAAYMKQFHTFTHGRMIFQQSGGTRDALEQHAQSAEPTILVTPAMKEGVDLKEDLSRVQIIWKCPYPSLADPAMKALSNSNPAWYKAQTLANFMQMYGRSIRSEKDWAKTYILDQALIDFLRQQYRKIPRYISEAIHWR